MPDAASSGAPPAPGPRECPCECPRCGYDLSGAAAAWDHGGSGSCPMRGMCSECGLEFSWGDVLNPGLHTPRWSFEHVIRRRPLALVRTLLVALRPAKLWRELTMAHPIRPARLAGLLVLGVPVLHLSLAALVFGVAYLNHQVLTATGPRWPMGAADWLRLAIDIAWPYSDDVSRILFTGRVGSSGLGLVYPWAGLVWAWWLAVAPTFVLLPTTLRRCRVKRSHLARIGVYSLVLATLAVPAGTCSGGFLKEVASSTLTHIERLTGAAVDYDLHYELWHFVDRWSKAAAIPFCFASIFVFWGFAAGRYLKLPRPWLIAFALTLLAGLVATALLALWPGFLAKLAMKSI